MIIKKIIIRNFRSYYKENTFELVNGLNLIIGANGDGKTTFFEALDWLFRTDGTKNMDTKYISKKRSEELDPSESDMVSVTMHYEHDNTNKILEKSFKFTKASDKEINTSNYDYTLITDDGVERFVKNGTFFDYDISSDIRKYIMFKGEIDLDIFQKSSALKMLVDTFSDVRDFETYFQFMEFATEKAEKAKDHAQDQDKKNADKIKSFRRIIETEKGILSDIEREINQKANEATNFESLLKNIEKSKEASQLLKAVNRRIQKLTEKRDSTRGLIREDYTINLLDDLWVLMGFGDIAEEYSNKIHRLIDKRQQLNDEYLLQLGAEKYKEKIKTDFIPLPVNVPGYKYLQKMIDQEICMCCNRPAEKGSDAWKYIKQRLDEFMESTTVSKDTDKIEPLFVNNYISELQKRENILSDNLPDILKLRYKISEAIAFNNRLHNDVRKLESNIDNEFEQKKRILAQSDGLTEDQLLANFENISNWTNQQRDAEDRIKTLKAKRNEHRAILEDNQNKLGNLAKGTTAELYKNFWDIIRRIAKAFKEAKEANKTNLLHMIEDESNIFLDKLNVDDFKGTIRIIEKGKEEAEAVLMNNDNTRIFNPNTALRTTYLMSVLFAVGEIASRKKESPFPLIFDAPTSSFTEKKESEFFDVISKLNKQVIIVTKSFLHDNGNGIQTLKTSEVKKLNGRVFRIEKKRPFDDRKLGTIQTVVTPI